MSLSKRDNIPIDFSDRKKFEDKIRGGHSTVPKISNWTEFTIASLLIYNTLFHTSQFIFGKGVHFSFQNLEESGKGRDWHDFEWYVRNSMKLDFIHLQKRIREFNNINVN